MKKKEEIRDIKEKKVNSTAKAQANNHTKPKDTFCISPFKTPCVCKTDSPPKMRGGQATKINPFPSVTRSYNADAGAWSSFRIGGEATRRSLVQIISASKASLRARDIKTRKKTTLKKGFPMGATRRECGNIQGASVFGVAG